MRITNTWKRPEKWVVVMLMLVFSLNFLGFAAAPKQVKIQVDGQTIALSTRALTVKGALEEAGVVLQKADGYDVVGHGTLKMDRRSKSSVPFQSRCGIMEERPSIPSDAKR